MTNAERQRAFRARKRAEGLSACTVMVPADKVAIMQMIAAAMARDPSLTVRVMTHEVSGRLVSLERAS